VRMIRTKPELDGIPVIANADFGHTTPQFTFPVGGQGRLMAMEGNAQLEVVEH
jgi:muramoyltetrapeptide carboxypeptidase